MSYPKVPQQISDPISENLAKLAEIFPAAVNYTGAFELGKDADSVESTFLNWIKLSLTE